MRGISLVKIEFKGYALEFKKNDPTRNENKERIKNNKNPSKANCFSLIFFRLCPH
ncbi:hypothetical protein HPHPA27_0848 [Helicobacter pylori Hp A-27]|nr:hypothetical protein HPHPA27_0848 [Helicobacter pylori Hp A-27]